MRSWQPKWPLLIHILFLPDFQQGSSTLMQAQQPLPQVQTSAARDMLSHVQSERGSVHRVPSRQLPAGGIHHKVMMSFVIRHSSFPFNAGQGSAVR